MWQVEPPNEPPRKVTGEERGGKEGKAPIHQRGKDSRRIQVQLESMTLPRERPSLK